MKAGRTPCSTTSVQCHVSCMTSLLAKTSSACVGGGGGGGRERKSQPQSPATQSPNLLGGEGPSASKASADECTVQQKLVSNKGQAFFNRPNTFFLGGGTVCFVVVH